MSQMISQEDNLNISRFLQEHMDFDEQPSEEEIIQKAQELGIKDLGLAKQSLVKELDPEWKPYMNRSEQIFYINLEERKAYRDHPIDMEFKITYALRNKLKIPTFRQYQIQQISHSLGLIQNQIRSYHNSHPLNVVYEQSQQQQSARRNTHLSNQQEEEMYEADLKQFIEANEQELQNYRRELQQEMKTELKQYRKAKESQYILRGKKHEANIEEIKNSRIKEVAAQFEAEWIARNQSNYLKAIDTTRQELQTKRQKYQNLLQRQIDVFEHIHNLRLSQKELKIINRQKIIRQKIALEKEFMHSFNLSMKQKANKQLCSAVDKYQLSARQLAANRINYKESIERNIHEISRLVNDSRHTKKRLSIFKSELHEKKQMSENDEERLMQQLKINQQIWMRNEQLKSQYCPQVKGSLSLRLMKRIL